MTDAPDEQFTAEGLVPLPILVVRLRSASGPQQAVQRHRGTKMRRPMRMHGIWPWRDAS